MALNMAQKSEASTLHPLAQECSPCLEHAVTEEEILKKKRERESDATPTGTSFATDQVSFLSRIITYIEHFQVVI
jgi:hypothetical protein